MESGETNHQHRTSNHKEDLRNGLDAPADRTKKKRQSLSRRRQTERIVEGRITQIENETQFTLERKREVQSTLERKRVAKEQQPLEMLKAHDKVAWNRWRSEHPDIQIDLSRADLHGLDLRGFDLSSVNLVRAILKGSILEKVNLQKAILTQADLSGATLNEADLNDTTLVKAEFRGADLRHAKLVRANMTDADLSEAILQNVDLTQVVSSKKTDLTDADLTEATLIGANLSGAILKKVNLTNAKLSDADLSGAILKEAKLINAILSEKTDLTDADLTEATLIGANFSGAILKKANFDRVYLSQTIFKNVDLREAKGLKTAVHSEPSAIDIDTIDRSRSNVPIEFLRGAGTPEIIIASMFANADHPMKYRTCFISYSSKNKDFANKLNSDLIHLGVTCWYAPVDLPIGEDFDRVIGETIRNYEKLLLVLSEHSAQSEWVKREVRAALQKERQQKSLVLFPITLDEAFQQTKVPWVRYIGRKRHIGDFTSWQQPDAYLRELAHLLRYLKADA